MDQFKARLSDLYTAVKTEKLEKIFATEMMSTKQEIERLWSEIYNLQANIQQLQTSEQILKITKTKLENDIVMKDDILKQKDQKIKDLETNFTTIYTQHNESNWQYHEKLLNCINDFKLQEKYILDQ